MSSSSDTDEEEKQRLKESVIGFQLGNLFKLFIFKINICSPYFFFFFVLTKNLFVRLNFGGKKFRTRFFILSSKLFRAEKCSDNV